MTGVVRSARRTNASSSVNGNVSRWLQTHVRAPAYRQTSPQIDIRHVAVRKKYVRACAPQFGRGGCEPEEGARPTPAPSPLACPPRDFRLVELGHRPAVRVAQRLHLDGRPLDLLQVPGERERLPLRTAEARPLEDDRDPDPARRGCDPAVPSESDDVGAFTRPSSILGRKLSVLRVGEDGPHLVRVHEKVCRSANRRADELRTERPGGARTPRNSVTPRSTSSRRATRSS